MVFTEEERAYLAGQRLGRLATVQPDGTLQVSPVGFRYRPGGTTIDIAGIQMARTRKFRNVAANGRVAFVVDDVVSVDPWRVRCLEIRGRGEAIAEPTDSAYGPLRGIDGAIIRIHPERIIAFGIADPDRDPHELVANVRDVTG
ncbi:PPOX class F420-dependent oxidoreductase [Nocardia panacis]|uniref:PPOX class F420-dependent oxidoreductase n=1 Tax=Nocardia panacis TaxID=2340916 RepID=A0A3A4K4H9_9NOCA|nr:PPOX class F420-dependent oxidoreductase [Nocardia panacis]RJO69154.1 PPOX class F420-dependent oxidoreductase [Nocardia panacis]